MQMPLFLGVLVSIVAASAFIGYILGHTNKQPDQVTSIVHSNDLLTEIDKTYKLPLDEQPTIVTIKDQDKLKDQTFFKDAQNGDKLVVYSNAKLAIIYRTTDHKLINVGPVKYDETTK